MKLRKAYKNVTLKNVADEAGVSPSTVSRYINNPNIVDDETKGRIKTAIEKLNYICPKKNVNLPSSSKAVSSKGIIALIIPNDNNPYYQNFIFLFEKHITASGYLMLLCLFNNDADNIDSYLQNLMDQHIDGCIMSYIDTINSRLISQFLKKIPTVTFNFEYPGNDAILADEYTASYEMVSDLIKLGHKKIGYIGYFPNFSVASNRIIAYRQALSEHDIPIREEYISDYQGAVGIDFETSYRESCRLLSLPERPTAIFCFNLNTAIGVCAAIRDFKLRIPGDISVFTFDDVPIAQLFNPQITVASFPLDAMIPTAVDFLLKRIRGDSNQPIQRIVFPSVIHKRGSTGPVNTTA